MICDMICDMMGEGMKRGGGGCERARKGRGGAGVRVRERQRKVRGALLRENGISFARWTCMNENLWSSERTRSDF